MKSWNSGEKIKYITLDKDTQTEMFYNGGEYFKMGNELIFLQNGPSTWSFRTKLRDDDNNIYYTLSFRESNVNSNISSYEIKRSFKKIGISKRINFDD